VAKAKTESGEKKPSQMGMVRAALEELGYEAKPQEMQTHIKTKFGVELPPNIISNYKSQLKRKVGAPAGPGRGRRAATAAPEGGLQVADFEAIRMLVNRLGSDQVKRLVDVVA